MHMVVYTSAELCCELFYIKRTESGSSRMENVLSLLTFELTDIQMHRKQRLTERCSVWLIYTESVAHPLLMTVSHVVRRVCTVCNVDVNLH